MNRSRFALLAFVLAVCWTPSVQPIRSSLDHIDAVLQQFVADNIRARMYFYQRYLDAGVTIGENIATIGLMGDLQQIFDVVLHETCDYWNERRDSLRDQHDRNERAIRQAVDVISQQLPLATQQLPLVQYYLRSVCQTVNQISELAEAELRRQVERVMNDVNCNIEQARRLQSFAIAIGSTYGQAKLVSQFETSFNLILQTDANLWKMNSQLLKTAQNRASALLATALAVQV